MSPVKLINTQKKLNGGIYANTTDHGNDPNNEVLQMDMLSKEALMNPESGPTVNEFVTSGGEIVVQLSEDSLNPLLVTKKPI